MSNKCVIETLIVGNGETSPE